MSDNTSYRGVGIGFAEVLTVLFIGLKLTGYVDWSWWWVLSPLWISVAIVVGVLLTVGLFFGIRYIIEKIIG